MRKLGKLEALRASAVRMSRARLIPVRRTLPRLANRPPLPEKTFRPITGRHLYSVVIGDKSRLRHKFAAFPGELTR